MLDKYVTVKQIGALTGGDIFIAVFSHVIIVEGGLLCGERALWQPLEHSNPLVNISYQSKSHFKHT